MRKFEDMTFDTQLEIAIKFLNKLGGNFTELDWPKGIRLEHGNNGEYFLEINDKTKLPRNRDKYIIFTNSCQEPVCAQLKLDANNEKSFINKSEEFWKAFLEVIDSQPYICQ